MIRLWGKARRSPFVPAVNNKAPIDAARPDADGDDVTLHVLHGVVDRQTSGDRSTWGVDVQVDGLAAVFGIEIQHLGNEAVRNSVIHIRAEEQNSLNAKTGVLVDPALHLAASRGGISRRCLDTGMTVD